MKIYKLFDNRLTTIHAGILSCAAYAYLAFHSQHYGQASLSQMLGVCFFCAALCFWTWHQHHSNNTSVSISHLIFFAVIFRIIGILSFPILEDDMYRYLWDARMTVQTGSPYGVAPMEFFTSPLLDSRFEDILDLINHPEIPTVYGPTNQWFFALAYLISPGSIWPLQLIFSVCDLVLILVLLRLAKPNNVLLYAWCPLVIKEFAFTAHPDVLGAMCLMLAVLLTKHRYYVLAGSLLACAAGVKVFALLLVPFILRLQWRGWLAFVLSAIALAWPFGMLQAWVPEGLRTMTGNWLFNAPLYTLLETWLSIGTIKVILVNLLAIASGAYLLHIIVNRTQTEVRGDLLIAGLLLAIPALNPWYLVWLLPFAVIRPSLWAWVASVSILLAYVSGLNVFSATLDNYQIPSAVLGIEFSVIVLAAILDRRLTTS